MCEEKRLELENGYYLFKLEKLLYDRNISINKLMRDTNTDYKVIKRLMNGDIARIDTMVLARFCDYLECNIIDIFDYIRK